MNEETGQCISECEPVTGFQRSEGSGELPSCWNLCLKESRLLMHGLSVMSCKDYVYEFMFEV
jgi:hypothetical protein